MSDNECRDIIVELKNMENEDLTIVWVTIMGFISNLNLSTEQSEIIDRINQLDNTFRRRTMMVVDNMMRHRVRSAIRG